MVTFPSLKLPGWTAPRRHVAAALLFLGCALLAGIAPGQTSVQYHVFGLVEGLLALLLTYILVLRRAWAPASGLTGAVALGYGALANAQLWELLLPKPGVLEWVVVVGIAFSAWGALGRGSRYRLMAALASLALLLAVLKFSVVPAFYAEIGPAPGDLLGLGDLAERSRRVIAGAPPETGAQWVGVVALALWVLATRLLWPNRPPRSGAAPQPSPEAVV